MIIINSKSRFFMGNYGNAIKEYHTGSFESIYNLLVHFIDYL